VRIRFGEFAFDVETRQLTRAGEPVHLTPKAFQLLQILLEKRPAAVSKEELIEMLWPDVLVEEANLKNLIAEIRTALGDAGPNPRVIRTAHRFGYAFSREAREEASSVEGTHARLLDGDKAYQLITGENLIGREPDCRIVLDAPGVSRHHARIRVSLDQAILEDLGSKNGTWLNGRRIDAPIELHHRDKIRIGVVTVTFTSAQRLETTATVE
jgi:DNA-binding winged helix-turn-helix (wHTH) protein